MANEKTLVPLQDQRGRGDLVVKKGTVTGQSQDVASAVGAFVGNLAAEASVFDDICVNVSNETEPDGKTKSNLSVRMYKRAKAS